MGSGFSCFNPSHHRRDEQPHHHLIFTSTDHQDEINNTTSLGHSFCYVPSSACSFSSARFLSPTNSLRFISPSHSLRFSPPHHETTSSHRHLLRAISGASVSANTLTPNINFNNTNNNNNDYNCVNNNNNNNGFESTSSFCALPLQPLPKSETETTTSAFFMSGPIERGALSGPMDSDAGGNNGGRVPFSAPLNGGTKFVKKKRGLRKAFQRPWVVPLKKDNVGGRGREEIENEDVQWALGKAGEDRVHVVVSEEHGWLFVGIYDGFNGPDAPEFLMGHLCKATYKELEGLFWDSEETCVTDKLCEIGARVGAVTKKVTFETGVERRKRLWEYLAQDELEDGGFDLSGSERFAFSVDDAVSVSKSSLGVSKRSLLLSKLRNGFSKRKEQGGKFFAWRFGLGGKDDHKEVENRIIEETGNVGRTGRIKKVGPVDHELVLRAMSRALEVTELAYLDMTDKVMDQYPELAVMGSCLLVVLMRDDDVYVMNVGDSRAIVAQQQEQPQEVGSSGTMSSGVVVEGIVGSKDGPEKMNDNVPAHDMRLTALQLSTDHSTSIEEEITRIKNEHPDDNQCIVNGRVKGRLKVTRAFGAGFLKQPKWNDSLLEMFRNEYIGTAPYISCEPSLRHHHLSPRDQFLILSSDGLYQYFTNEEVVSHVENFMEKFPDGDPAQHLIEELLLRAAKKAGMDLHELLDIPQGDRRRYHDDVTVMVISLEGQIWKSSGKYL
uniref:protein phosphatase 2C 29-like n=1 Tax=Erigeron canadensis TaxID=72917 RepID=UPI001CB93F67|nr:protein phosphatase 2C 29-like [Erigeron canadensis]